MINKRKNLIYKTGLALNAGRFLLIVGCIYSISFLSGCSDKTTTSEQEAKQFLPTTETTSQEAIVMQNQMQPDFYSYIFEKATKDSSLKTSNVWGIAIPHHQLAADVMAQTLKQIAANDYSNIIILSPDHFTRGKTKISLVESPLKLATGTTQISQSTIETISELPNVGNADGFITYEHGIGTPLPFVESLWPKATITPILVRGDAKKEDLQELLKFLQAESQKPTTLIIESSDFSHYLDPQTAYQKDLQTIQTLSQNDPEKTLSLNQPDNCDSVNILYMMKNLQITTKSSLNIYLNKNSQDYTKEKVISTTSYITFFLSK